MSTQRAAARYGPQTGRDQTLRRWLNLIKFHRGQFLCADASSYLFLAVAVKKVAGAVVAGGHARGSQKSKRKENVAVDAGRRAPRDVEKEPDDNGKDPPAGERGYRHSRNRQRPERQKEPGRGEYKSHCV